MTAPDNSKSHFVSDLHLFSRRSTGDRLMPELHRAVSQSHTFILGGDIFDFKWSTYHSLDHSLDEAERWLEDLRRVNPDCEFHFVLGNHDCHPSFVERLESFSDRIELFQWHQYFVRLGSCLFLHGDVVSKGAHDHNVLDDLRAKHHYKKNKPPVSHLAYDVAVKARLHRVAMFAIRENVVLERVHGYAEHIGHGPDDGVTDVYFGHTHIRMDGIEFGGLRFHNGGGAIHGLPFRILETEATRD